MLLAVAAVTLPLAAGEAAAEEKMGFDADGNRTMTVRYGDLDLSAPEGADRLMRRIERAARRTCSVDPSMRMRMFRAVQQCSARATEQAVAQVNDPNLWAAYETRTARG
jgi:UrcA family protein